jgi:hypothetical protein
VEKSRRLVVNANTEAEDIGEETADLEDFVRALVNCTVCELATALQLLVVTSYECSIQPNPRIQSLTYVTVP